VSSLVGGYPIVSGGGGGGGGMTNPMTAVGDMIRGGTGGTPARLVSGSEGDVLTMHGGVPIWLSQQVSQIGLLVGANTFNCNQIGGFTNRLSALKATSWGTGVVNKVGVYVFNSTSGAQLQLGVYDLNGALLTSGSTTLAASQNKTVVLSVPPVNVVSGVQYWLAVWGVNCDIPVYTSFSINNSTFPSGMHAVQNLSLSGGLPLTISGANTSGTTTTFPITAFS
jgi:hypothetical protein